MDGDHNYAGHCKKTDSSIDIKKETGTHDFRIINLSFCEAVAATKIYDSLTSSEFTVGRYKWMLEVQPSSWRDLNGTLSILLLPKDKCSVNAQATFSFLDQSGNPSPRSLTIGPCIVDSDRERGDAYISAAVTQKELEEWKCIVDDGLTIRCTLTVGMFSYLKNQHCSILFSPPSGLAADLGNILRSGTCSDITVQVEGKEFFAHKAVLAARSHVFRTQLFGPQPVEGNLTIQRMKAPVFGVILKFIYEDVMCEEDMERGCATESDTDARYQDLLVGSERYGLNKLKKWCLEKLSARLDTKNVCGMLVFACQHNYHDLKASCLELLADEGIISIVAREECFEEVIKICPSALWEYPAYKKRKL